MSEDTHDTARQGSGATTASLAGLDGSSAIVTGGSSGIGRAMVHRLVAEGSSVVVADILEDEARQVVADVEASGGEAVFQLTDVSDEAQVEAAVERAVEEFGGLDVALNNAGIEGESIGTAEQEAADWDRVLDINLKGIWHGMKHQIPRMLEDGGGAIVNTASVAGLVGFEGLAPYTASKHGVIGLTRTAALEYSSEGVRVNAVCPGVIDTPMVERTFQGDPDALQGLIDAEPIGRLGEPEEIAAAAVWLCSEDASFVTGHPMVVDGGYISQ